jgi:glycosyltransferase involved in cell wall biosynthesis
MHKSHIFNAIFLGATLLFGFYNAETLPNEQNKELPLVMLVCSYNNAPWVTKNLDSIFSQEYTNFRVLYYDDASEDDTVTQVLEYIEQHNLHDKIELMVNGQRQRKLYNIYNAFHSCEDNEIIVQLDGDDWLAHNKVLTKLNAIFKNPNIWFSYGQYKQYPSGQMGYCKEIPQSIKREGSFKKKSGGGGASHIKAFYAWLAKAIKLENLITENIQNWSGQFYPAANDSATVYPMLEMSREHIYFNPEVLYIYNIKNPTSHTNTSEKSLQLKCDQEIKTFPIYDYLKEPLLNRLNQYNNAIADIIVFSKNNIASSALATLISLKANLKGVSDIILLYNSSDKSTETEFKAIEKIILNTTCINLYNQNNISYEVFGNSSNNHIIITTDEILLEQPINITDNIRELERTSAHGVYFSLSKEMFENHDIPYQRINNNVYAWKFKCDKNQILTMNNSNFTLYRKKDVAEYVFIQIVEPHTYHTELINIDKRKVGLFYQNSTIRQKT